ncbi:hypothetical protein C2845_PM16G04000 [Panicum miliaceum]|uniref:Uncharacterized protein n=1 Tax=Panicum miliaceum TaxID=4540 RepID=A0A3L6PTS7_PANMI|nr:hypothetical protein C2845_PM16G04000 [Panicum miliaceum]
MRGAAPCTRSGGVDSRGSEHRHHRSRGDLGGWRPVVASSSPAKVVADVQPISVASSPSSVEQLSHLCPWMWPGSCSYTSVGYTIG